MRSSVFLVGSVTFLLNACPPGPFPWRWPCPNPAHLTSATAVRLLPHPCPLPALGTLVRPVSRSHSWTESLPLLSSDASIPSPRSNQRAGGVSSNTSRIRQPTTPHGLQAESKLLRIGIWELVPCSLLQQDPDSSPAHPPFQPVRMTYGVRHPPGAYTPTPFLGCSLLQGLPSLACQGISPLILQAPIIYCLCEHSRDAPPDSGMNDSPLCHCCLHLARPPAPRMRSGSLSLT